MVDAGACGFAGCMPDGRVSRRSKARWSRRCSIGSARPVFQLPRSSGRFSWTGGASPASISRTSTRNLRSRSTGSAGTVPRWRFTATPLGRECSSREVGGSCTSPMRISITFRPWRTRSAPRWTPAGSTPRHMRGQTLPAERQPVNALRAYAGPQLAASRVTYEVRRCQFVNDPGREKAPAPAGAFVVRPGGARCQAVGGAGGGVDAPPLLDAWSA